MKEQHYYAHSPGMVYAISVWAKSKEEARAKLRFFLGVKRLKNGSDVWQKGGK